MPKLEIKSFPFEVKAKSEDGSTFEGYGAAFYNIDGIGDIIDPAAYNDFLDFFKAQGKVRDEHFQTTGRITDARADAAQGLFVKGMISDTAAGRDQRTLLRDNVIDKLSIGHHVLDRKWLETPEAVQAYWKSVGYTPSDQDLVRSAYPVRLITKAKPYEVSTVWFPANERANVTSVKSGEPQGGRRLADHILATLESAEDLLGRLQALAAKRRDKGGDLGLSTKALVTRLGDAQARLLSLLDAPGSDGPTPAEAPETKSGDDAPQAVDGTQLFAEFQRTLADLNAIVHKTR